MKLQTILNEYFYERKLYANKKFVNSLKKIFNNIPEKHKLFEHEKIVTFNLTTQEMNVSHSKFPELFGVTRELYGLKHIPNFKTEVGNNYLLKTRNCSFFYLKDFHFGDTMKIKMGMTELNDISYNLIAGFFCGDELRTIGFQKIVYTDMEGKPVKMPVELKQMFEIFELKTNQEQGVEQPVKRRVEQPV